MRKTAIVVPCYNEYRRINPDAFLKATRESTGLDFIFVDDGSTDSTLGMLKALNEKEPERIQYVSLNENSGKAEAVRQGFLKAFEDDYRNIGYWDADLSTPLDVIRVFCDSLDDPGCTMVIGSRVKLLGRSIERRLLRHYLGRLFATAASIVLNVPVYDTQCGAKIFKNTESLKRAFSVPFMVKWTFDVELLARLAIVEKSLGNKRPDAQWVEQPLDRWEDVKGSKIRTADFITGGAELCKVAAMLYLPFLKKRYAGNLTAKNL